MQVQNNYGFFSRLLHRLALSSDAIGEVTFDIESLLFSSPEMAKTKGSPVFVAGLARAGTTLLMRLLYETGQFSSLTYRDMPFVLAPNLWRRLSGGTAKISVETERAHGDGMLVGFDSPEALEEVFWRVMCGSDYIFDDHLAPTPVPPEVIQKFRIYIGLILRRYDGTRYLSKNNNNILRLNAIREAFPDAVILVPFRNPISQSLSLLEQHRHFIGMHKTDRFSKEYMAWLTHHEFGSAHLPFIWGISAKEKYSASQQDYWLEQWLEVYTYLLKLSQQSGLGLLFVDYDRLCLEPLKYWDSLSKAINVSPALSSGISIRPPEPAANSWQGDGELLLRANSLYRDLADLSRQNLHAQ